MIDIIIPTMKPAAQLTRLLADLAACTPEAHRVIATCLPASAAVNRNHGLAQATSAQIVMADDDMTGWYAGWLTDLLTPLTDRVAMVSARLLKPDGSLGYMLSENDDLRPDTLVIAKRELPTACVAFHRTAHRFDEHFIGSGFEDNDFCRQLAKAYPDRQFLVVNRCRLIHNNEMKNQRGHYWEHNRRYFHHKWAATPPATP